jgi:hypothetical protein
MSSTPVWQETELSVKHLASPLSLVDLSSRPALILRHQSQHQPVKNELYTQLLALHHSPASCKEANKNGRTLRQQKLCQLQRIRRLYLMQNSTFVLQVFPLLLA